MKTEQKLKELYQEYLTKKVNIKPDNIRKEDLKINNQLLKNYINSALKVLKQ